MLPAKRRTILEKDKGEYYAEESLKKKKYRRRKERVCFRVQICIILHFNHKFPFVYSDVQSALKGCDC